MAFVGGPLAGRHARPRASKDGTWPYALQGDGGGYVRLPEDNYLVTQARALGAEYAETILYWWIGCACTIGATRPGCRRAR